MKTSGGEWVLANIDVTGYYRVHYDRGNWDKLIDQLWVDHKVGHRGGELIAFVHWCGSKQIRRFIGLLQVTHLF